MKKRTTKEVFPQVASVQQFFNYGHPTPQVPFTMQVGGSMTSGMSNIAMQTGQLPMMDMGSSFIDRQVSDAARMGYMAEGGITNNHVAPNFYINKLDKFMGKVKDMAARANEKRLMEDAMNMAQEKGIFQDGGPHTVSNTDMFTGMDFSKASNFLNNYNNMYSKVNADKVYDLANNMRMTAMANSTPYAKKIHTYDLANPYMQEDAQPINMPNPYKAMLPKDLGLAKYGLQTFQSDVNTGEKQEENKPLTNEELLAKIDEQNKRIEALEGKKSKCASGNCSPEEEADIAKEEENVKTSSSDLQGRLAVMDVKDKYRWNAASRFGNLLTGSSDPGRPGQLRERTYHYEFGKKGEMPPMGMVSGTGSMPSGVASIATDNSDVWKKWQGAAGVGEKPKTETKTATDKTSKDPYNIYPDSWEGNLFPKPSVTNPNSPVKPGFTPTVTKNPNAPVSTPNNASTPAPVIAPSEGPSEDEWIDNPTPINGIPNPIVTPIPSPVVAQQKSSYTMPGFDMNRSFGQISNNEQNYFRTDADINNPDWRKQPIDNFGGRLYDTRQKVQNSWNNIKDNPVNNDNDLGKQGLTKDQVAKEYDKVPAPLKDIAMDHLFNASSDPRIFTLAAAGAIDINESLKYKDDPRLLEDAWAKNIDLINQQYKDDPQAFTEAVSDYRKLIYRKSRQKGIDTKSTTGQPGLQYNAWAGRTDNLQNMLNNVYFNQANGYTSPEFFKKRGGALSKFIRQYAGDVGSSEVFDPGMWEIDTGEDFGNNQGLGYNQAGTAQTTMPIGKAPELPEQNWINTGQDITMGQNFGMGAYIAPIMEMVANRRDAAKQKKGDVMNKFGYENLVNPVTGDKGVYDQFGNQFPDKRNFNMYYGKSGGEMYEEGGVYFLDDATIKQLKAGGAIIEYID